MKKISLIAVALMLCSAVAASAATVTFTLDLSNPGQFELRAKSSPGDNAGIATYGVVLIPQPGITINTLDHKSARAGAAENTDGSLGGPIGFTTLRSADGAANVGIRGGQDTLTPTPFIIYGYGQQAGSFATVTNGPATPLGSNEGNNWTAEPVIASGTYSGGSASTPLTPILFDLQTVDLLANVFTNSSGLLVQPATINTDIIPIVPEPATIAMAGLGLVGLVAVSRRRK